MGGEYRLVSMDGNPALRPRGFFFPHPIQRLLEYLRRLAVLKVIQLESEPLHAPLLSRGVWIMPAYGAGFAVEEREPILVLLTGRSISVKRVDVAPETGLGLGVHGIENGVGESYASVGLFV